MRHWLIEMRKRKAMTQDKLASLAGISRSYYTQIELSQRRPSIRTAKLLAALMGFEWTCFYDDDAGQCDYPAGQTSSAP